MSLSSAQEKLLADLLAKKSSQSSNIFNSNSYQKKEFDPKTYVKKSGCKTGRYTNKEYTNKETGEIVKAEDKPYTQGWKASKGIGIISIFCAPTSKSRVVRSENGVDWITSIACTITNKKLMTKTLSWGLMDKRTGKVIIQDLGIVLNPKGGKGGVVAEIGKGQ